MAEPTPEQLLSSLHRAEEALERCERKAIASRYAGAIMHEVNNPLEAITNLVYLTNLQKDDPAQVGAYMEIIADQLRVLGSVTSQALTYHRDQAEAADTDLVRLTNAVLKLHTEKLDARGISVRRHFAPSAMAVVHGNEIFQVLSNLILNAVDALPASGQGRIAVSVHSRGHFVQIAVADNGSGIPDTVLPHLFEAYSTSKQAGTGLGLWLSRRIIERHGGKLRFRTSRRSTCSGTTFRITLPQLKAA